MKQNLAGATTLCREAKGLIKMFGRCKEAEAARLYEAAAECVPADAMAHLDVELARSELVD